jgi:site-specific recombinase XerD
LKLEQILAFKKSCEEQGNKTNTLRLKIQALRFFFDFLVAEGNILENPLKEIRQVDYSTSYTPHILTLAEVELFLNHINERSGNVRAAFTLMLCTGLTVAEIASLTAESFSFQEQRAWIKVRKRTVKVESSYCSEILWYYLEGITDVATLVFRLKRDSYRQILYRLSKETDIELTCTGLRVTYASGFLVKGLYRYEVAEKLGIKKLLLNFKPNKTN